MNVSNDDFNGESTETIIEYANLIFISRYK